MLPRALWAAAARPGVAPRWAAFARRGLATAARAAHEPSFTAPPATTRVTTLPNGLRVATEDLPGHFYAVGVYVDAGTRNECDAGAAGPGSVSTEGVAHLLDRMAFKSTENHTSSDLVQQFELLGGNVVAHSSRESIIYQACVFPKDLETIVRLFSEVILRPAMIPSELDEVRESTLWEIGELQNKPDMVLPEILHQVAYGGKDGHPNTVGRPLLVSPERLQSISVDAIQEFRQQWFTPNRMVVAGIGMPHDELVKLAEAHFGSMKAPSQDLLASQSRLALPATYTGGVLHINTLEHPLPPANPDHPHLTHVHIAFEALPMTDPDIYPLATLNTMMGGGGSFSAGGPGKGMYSRLYTRVLNRHHWMENCQMFNFSYLDTGLFGIQASVPSERGAHARVLGVLCEQLQGMTERIGAEELQRAKNQLRSNLLMSLESKVVELEDVGRQVLAHGRRVGAFEMCELIGRITEDDVRRVARRTVWGMDLPASTVGPNAHPALRDSKPSIRTGTGEPTVVVQAPLKQGDPLWDVEATFKQYRIGRKNSGLGKIPGLRRLFGRAEA
ncbi:peptidase M16 inactive domain-containing protein [Hyaloraphidium curvatum]|nr:peptidase M16 inactive domain-containing protein [Hyaloraphidium curvatum]